MFIKLGILAAALVLGGLIFANEIDMFFPTTSAALTDSVKTDVTNISNNATDAVEERIDESFNEIVNGTTSTISDQMTKMGEEISIELGIVQESIEQVMGTLYDTITSIDL